MNQTAASYYVEENDIWGLPQKFKDLVLYPITIGQVELKTLLYKIFCHPKNYIPDAQIVRMSYLKFLVYAVQSTIKDGDEGVDGWLSTFFKGVCRTDNAVLRWEKRDGVPASAFDSVQFFLVVNGVSYTERDFKHIREIVLQQNGLSIEYVEDYKPDLEEMLHAIPNEMTGAQFKDEVTTFCALNRCLIDDIKDYTLVQFHEHFQRLLMLQTYELCKPVEWTSPTKIKNPVPHYFTPLKRQGRYDSILIEKDKYIQKNKAVFE
jgi:hypothetical protein